MLIRPSLSDSCEHTWIGELFFLTLDFGCRFTLCLRLANVVPATPLLPLSTWSGSCDGGSRKYRYCSSSRCQPWRRWRAVLQHQERSFSRSLQPTGEWAPSGRWVRNCWEKPQILFTSSSFIIIAFIVFLVCLNHSRLNLQGLIRFSFCKLTMQVVRTVVQDSELPTLD